MAAWALRHLLSSVLFRAALGELKVIGAGLPRTGTESLADALVILGYGWLTHGHCNWPNLCQETACSWMSNNSNATPLLNNIEDKKMQFVADEPLNLAYKEFADHWPESKVVLTVRDSPSQWLRSFAAMQGALWEDRVPKTFKTPDFLRIGDPWTYCDQLPHTLFDCDIFTDSPLEEDVERCINGYERFNAEVQQTIPKERLLVFNVKEGWGPLCEFLGKPVPDQPFPHADHFMNKLRRWRRNEFYGRRLVVYLCAPALLAVLLWPEAFRRKVAAIVRRRPLLEAIVRRCRARLAALLPKKAQK